MPDPGNPDQDPKPFKPDPKKRLFDPPSGEPRRDFAEPDPNYDPDKADQAPATDQETLFRAAAIKCAEMQDQLIEIITNNYPPPYENFEKHVPGLSIKNSDYILISHESETSYNLAGKPTIIQFATNEDSVSRKAAHTLQTNRTPNRLTVFFIADEELSKKHEEYIAKRKTDSNGATDYFLTSNGGYFKACYMPMSAEKVDGKIPLIDGDNIYESKMTAEDFEVAGASLQALINRLEKPAEE